MGPIAASAVFAGQILHAPLPGHSLWVCPDCAVQFRFPAPSKDALDAMYIAASTRAWQSGITQRVDWQLASAFLDQHANIESVLDIGCFDGRFLSCLSERYRKFGIEIHPEARQLAEARGVCLVANDLAALPASGIRADVVTAMDVIEHTRNPLAFLSAMRDATTPGGFMLIATGNTSALSWRLMGSRYWYCTIGEHLSFINPAWCIVAANRLHLEVVQIRRFSHAGPNVSSWIRVKDATKNLVHRLAPKLSATLRRFGAGSPTLRRSEELLLAPPTWLSAIDHMLVVFRKL